MATRRKKPDLEAVVTFAYTDDDGNFQVVRAGECLTADHPATAERGELFTPVTPSS